MIDLQWRCRWEAELDLADHEALADLLVRVYPDFTHIFGGSRDWYGVPPEGRIIGELDGRPVAHMGFVRRTLRLDEGDDVVLVGDSGLFGVDPDLRRTGVGRRLLRQVANRYRELALPFGYLTCSTDVMPFYASGGWVRIEEQTSRELGLDRTVHEVTGHGMVLPVTASLDDWPRHRTIVRDGMEV